MKVPRALLPPSIEAKCADHDGDTIAKLGLVHNDAAHTLAHYIHTGTYQTLRLADDISAADRAAKEHERALHAYVAATEYHLPGLADLAKQEAEASGAAAPLGRALRNVENACEDLPAGDGWVREHLNKIIWNADLSCVPCDGFDSPFAGALMAVVAEIYAKAGSEMDRWEQMKRSIEGEEHGRPESVALGDQVADPLADEACVVSDAGSCHDPDEVNSCHDEKDDEKAESAYEVPKEEQGEISHNGSCTQSAEEMVNGVFSEESADSKPEESHWSECAAEEPPINEKSYSQEVIYPEEPPSYSGYVEEKETQSDEDHAVPKDPAVPDEHPTSADVSPSPPKEFSPPPEKYSAPSVSELESETSVELDPSFDEKLAQEEEPSSQNTAAKCTNVVEHLTSGGWKHCPYCSVTALHIQQDGHKL